MAGWNASHLAPKSFEWFFTFALCARPATGQRMGSGLPTELTMVLLVGFRSVGGHDRGGLGYQDAKRRWTLSQIRTELPVPVLRSTFHSL